MLKKRRLRWWKQVVLFTKTKDFPHMETSRDNAQVKKYSSYIKFSPVIDQIVLSEAYVSKNLQLQNLSSIFNLESKTLASATSMLYERLKGVAHNTTSSIYKLTCTYSVDSIKSITESDGFFGPKGLLFCGHSKKKTRDFDWC